MCAPCRCCAPLSSGRPWRWRRAVSAKAVAPRSEKKSFDYRHTAAPTKIGSAMVFITAPAPACGVCRACAPCAVRVRSLRSPQSGETARDARAMGMERPRGGVAVMVPPCGAPQALRAIRAAGGGGGHAAGASGAHRRRDESAAARCVYHQRWAAGRRRAGRHASPGLRAPPPTHPQGMRCKKHRTNKT